MDGGTVTFHFKGDDKDLDKATEKATTNLSKFGGIAKGISKAFGATAIASATAIARITKASVDAFAEFEQLEGGLKALFKDNIDGYNEVMKTAQTAYKDLQMSQNDYLKAFNDTYSIMKNGIGENADAIKYTNKMISISTDLYNNYGGSVEQYSGAINWALKGTYSYLDNLNIGIKGTKEGFIEATNQSGILKRNIADVSEMTNDEIIDVIEYYTKASGALGRSAEEASKTIQGSMNMMKASWNDLVASFGKKGAGLNKPIDNFVNSTMTFIDNLLPVLERVLTSMAKALPKLIEKIGKMLPSLFQNLLPSLIEATVVLVNSVVNSLPTLIKVLLPPLIDGVLMITENIIQMLPDIITMIADMLPTLMPQIIDAILSIIPMLIENLPLFIKAGGQLVGGILAGIINSIPLIIARLYEIGTSMLRWLATLPSQFWQGAKALWQGFINGINAMKDKVIEKIKNIGKSIIDKFKSIFGINSPSTVFSGVGKNLIQGLINGVGSMAGALYNKVKNIASNAISTIKKKLGIHSPSTEFAFVGKMSMLGYEEGLEKMQPEIQKAINGMFSLSPQLTGTMSNALSPEINVHNNISMETDPLGQMVSKVKTFAGGAKNDYNWGAGK